MAAHERLSINSSISPPSLLRQLASVLPEDIKFTIYHISTPPTQTSALYSAPPGARPDRTYCESHFLSASIRPPSKGTVSASTEVLVFAVEVLIYTTAHDTTFFVSKADSTGFLHLLNLPKGTSSPLREISGTFLRHLVDQRQRPNIRSVVSLFARAQDQYLFPGSVEYSGKHVLNDRGLVRWWCRVLNPLIEDSQSLLPTSAQWTSVKGYLTVPGLDRHEALSFVPGNSKTNWTIGHPLREISRHPSDVPPRCLIPHFPDDPKARYLDELDDEITNGRGSGGGQWKSVKSIDRFWEMMAFRQECSAGRLVGFIWIVFTPSTPDSLTSATQGDSQNTILTAGSEVPSTGQSFSALQAPKSLLTPSTSPSLAHGTAPSLQSDRAVSPLASRKSSRSPHKSKKHKFTGPVVPRRPRVKTENKNYLLERSVTSPYYLWNPEGRGQVILVESDYKRVTELLLRLDFANLDLASSSSSRWINEVRSGASGDMRNAWGEIVTGTKVVAAQHMTGPVGVNTLNVGLVRKKRKAGEEETKALPSLAPSSTNPVVNTLSAGVIRKKAKV